MTEVSDWLNKSCLSLNVSKTVCMHFTARKHNSVNPGIILNGEVIKCVTHVKYLGIIIDQHLSFKKQERRVINNVKFNLKNIRHQLSQSAALLFVHTLILPNLSYCITTRSQAGATTLKPVYSLHKLILKVLDKKPSDYHHCTILKKFNFYHFVFYSDVCLIHAPPLRGCLRLRGSL